MQRHNTESKDHIAISISIFQPKSDHIDQIKRRLDTTISTLIFKLEDGQPSELMQSIISKWLYHMDNTHDDPYHLNHLKEVIMDEIKNYNRKGTKNIFQLYLGLLAFIVLTYKLWCYCDQQFVFERDNLAKLVGTSSPNYLRDKARYGRHNEFGQPSLWEEKKEIVFFLTMSLFPLLIILGCKPIKKAKETSKVLTSVKQLVDESIKLQSQLSSLLKDNGQHIDKLLNFNPTIKDELQSILSRKNEMLKLKA